MFNKKSLLSKLGEVIISSALLLTPTTAKTDEWTDLQYTFGAILDSGVIPSKNCEDAKYLRNLGRLNMHLSMHNNKEGNCSFYTERVHKIDPTSQIHWSSGGYFSMYNYYKDDNNNKKNDFYDEFKGINNHIFYAGDSIYLRLDTFDLKGNIAHIKMFTEDGRKILEDSRNITHRSWFWYKDFKEDAKEITDAYGNGNYYAKFYINNGLLGIRFFNLQKRNEIFMCNYWSDDDNNEIVDIPREIVGYKRRQYFQNEKISIVTRSIGQEGKKLRNEIIDPNGNTVKNIESPIILRDNVNIMSYDTVKIMTENNGPGNYRIKNYVDDEFQGSTEFELRE